jgi:hypothetical protein
MNSVVSAEAFALQSCERRRHYCHIAKRDLVLTIACTAP